VQQVDEGGHGDEQQPEPDEQEDLLVEEVDRQHALDCVALQVVLLPDVKVAERDARETGGQWPPGRIGERR